jgi:outer membrane protein TolC
MRALPALLAAALALPAGAAPLTLDEALAVAARNNGDLGVARAVRDAAGVDLYQSYAGVLPRLDLAGGSGRRFIAGQSSVQVVPSLVRDSSGAIVDVTFASQVVPIPAIDFADHQLGLTLRWTLFDGLSSWRGIGAARERSRAADRQYDESVLQISFEVSRRFYDVVKQERILEVRRETAARSEDLVRRADALFTAGRGSRADTFAARVNLGNDRIAVETQRAEVERARADLALALGLDPDAATGVVPPAPVSGPGIGDAADPPPLEALVARAGAGRPLLAARRGAVAAADLDAGRARGGYWPVLGLEGIYQRQSTDLTGRGGVLGDLSRQYTALARVTFTWNLFQGRETLSAEQRAAVQARRARVESEQAGHQVAAEIARARAAAVALSRAAALAQDNQVAAEQGLALARERLEAGAATQLEVRDATVKLAEAKLALVAALVDHAVARADLNRAVGGTL